MLSGVPMVILAAALAPASAAPSATVAQGSYGPSAPAAAKPPASKTVAEACPVQVPNADTREIVVCAVKPQGYRIDPDVLAAKKAKKQALAGRPRPPERLNDRSCAVVGPAGCVFDAPGINLLAAAATVGKISERLAKGQEIGSIFVTDPQLTEYQYYQLAKAKREASQAAAEAKAKAVAAKANPAAGSANTP